MYLSYWCFQAAPLPLPAPPPPPPPGLGLTLLCLSVFQRALPALPFSIALGVLFYFLTRITLEPFLCEMTGHAAFF